MSKFKVGDVVRDIAASGQTGQWVYLVIRLRHSVNRDCCMDLLLLNNGLANGKIMYKQPGECINYMDAGCVELYCEAGSPQAIEMQRAVLENYINKKETELRETLALHYDLLAAINNPAEPTERKLTLEEL